MKEKFFNLRTFVFVLFAIKMILYYIAVDIPVFSGISYWVTLVFFALALYLYYNCTQAAKRVLRLLYFAFSLVLFIDVIYYNYFNQLVSVNQIWQIKNIKGTEDSVKAAIPWTSVLLLADLPVLCFLGIKFRKGSPIQPDKYMTRRRKRWLSLGLVFCIIMIALNPFRISAIQKINSTEAVTVHVKDAVDSTLGKVIYNQSSLGKILQSKSVSLNVAEDVSDKVLGEPGTDGEPGAPKQNAYANIGQGKNLIVIQIESMQNFVINAVYNGQEITPNLNRLLHEDTLYFNHFYTNMGKGNTSDAEFSVQTGLYPVIEGASYDLYMDNEFIALPELMAEQGHSTCACLLYTSDAADE